MTREILAVVDMGVLLADQAFYGIGVPRGASDLPTIRCRNARSARPSGRTGLAS
jgi:hypothetical protein